MSTIITVENLGKKYTIRHQKQGEYQTFRDTLSHGARSIYQRLRHPFSPDPEKIDTEEFWALKDINFEIKQGDRVGIIGRNGAGKSTLLKILSRITQPTTGKIHIKGRVASLLEVGTGFHPELTGRENIFLNGAILGMSKNDIKIRFDEIVTFAEIEKFLDTPVKRYSSGMYVRLAFAVAAHLEPEILLVDEVLAVGDAQFQKKCLGKMNEVAEEGRTVLFVSHNMASIKALCSKAIMFQQGGILKFGSVNDVVDEYTKTNFGRLTGCFNSTIPVPKGAKAWLTKVMVIDSKLQPNFCLPIDKSFSITIQWELYVTVPFLRLGIELINEQGIPIIFSVDTDSTNLNGKQRRAGKYLETVEIPGLLIMPGIYSVKVFAGIPKIERIMEMNNVIVIEIAENNTHLSNITGEKRLGYISTPLTWKVQQNNL